jgi:hypothetical protein
MCQLKQPKWLIGVFALLVLWGAFEAGSSYRTERLAKELPRMTCDELIRKGRSAPQYVILTDVHLGAAGHAFSRDMDAAMEMYVPVYSTKLKKEPRGPEFSLLLQVLDDRDFRRLRERPDVGELTVELWTAAADVDAWVEATLSKMYPGFRVTRCRVISVGLHEPSLFRAENQWIDGIGMMTLGAVGQLGWWIWCYIRRRCQSATVISSNADGALASVGNLSDS